MAVTERIKLGELLVRAGAIDRAQLKAALAEQEKWGLPLGMTLIELKFLDEETLVRTLARQLKVPLAWMRGKRVKPAVIDLIPAELARKHRYIPLTVRDEPEGRVLFLGMQDPGDLESLDNVSFRIGWKAKPILVAPSELEEALERYYPSEDADSRDNMLDLDPLAESESTDDVDAAETPEPAGIPEEPEESAEESDSFEMPDADTASEIADASEATGDAEIPDSWDMSEEWEVTAEPEFLVLEEVVQSLASVPVAPAELIAGASRGVSDASSLALLELVMTLVEEGAIDREALAERLHGASGARSD